LVATLARGGEAIDAGKDEVGFMHVQGQGGEGWVEKIMVKK